MRYCVKQFLNALTFCLLVTAPPTVCGAAEPASRGPYEADWESLSNVNQAPDWFRDAKFGIYFHWGVYSVPAFGYEWYPRWMYTDSDIHEHHVKSFGEVDEFGYADLVPLFKAEKFDADEWASLFLRSGARFAGPVVEHHDGFAMWDSKLTPWNAANMGPCRDITSELEKAIRKRDMKFVATFHHARNNLWERDGQWTGHFDGIKRNYPNLLKDAKRAILYGYMPRKEFLDMWLGKLKEVIDAYEPDLIWFDSWLDEIPEPYLQQFAAYYYNRANEWGREVVITRKQNDLPLEMSIEDFEKGRTESLTQNVWLTDDTISMGSWSYTQGLQIKKTDEVVDTLVDIVSKNGQLLLNISPKADGTIPSNQRSVLLEIGDWLKVNGEAIYNTRPWLDYGEGPTRMKRGGHYVGHVYYGANDIRYTQSKDGNVLYVTLLGWPAGPVILQKVKATGDPGAVSLLGSLASVTAAVNEQGQPVLELPPLSGSERPSQYAHSLKFTNWELTLNEEAIERMEYSVFLDPQKAHLNGEQLRIEEPTPGQRNVGYWDDDESSVHWLANIKKSGAYRVTVNVAAESASHLSATVIDQTISAEVSASGSYRDSHHVDLGTFEFESPGVYHIKFHPTSGQPWRPINLFGVTFVPI